MEPPLEPCLPGLAAVADQQPLANFLWKLRVGGPSKDGSEVPHQEHGGVGGPSGPPPGASSALRGREPRPGWAARLEA